MLPGNIRKQYMLSPTKTQVLLRLISFQLRIDILILHKQRLTKTNVRQVLAFNQTYQHIDIFVIL
jgi:hypothetical protein